jgi:hypothetical protein
MSHESPVPIDVLRRRVREAEALLGVARGLARDELHDPGTCERARDRIVGILREIDSLFPGLKDPPAALDPSELIAPSLRSQAADRTSRGDCRSSTTREDEDAGEPENGAEVEDGDDGTQEEGGARFTHEDSGADDRDDADELEPEGELDHKKLALAIEDAELMAKIPEIDREWFKRMARRSIEAQERIELCDRVRRAFDDLARAMRQGLDETSRQLSMALTFEYLKSKQQQ